MCLKLRNFWLSSGRAGKLAEFVMEKPDAGSHLFDNPLDTHHRPREQGLPISADMVLDSMLNVNWDVALSALAAVNVAHFL